MAGPTGPATFAPRCEQPRKAGPTSTGPMARSHPPGSGRGHGVGTLLGCMPGIIRPLPPTVLVSSCPNRGDRDHDRAGSIPATARQPDSWIRTGWNSRASCREHQPEHPTEVSWALQPRRHGRERAERGGQGTNPGRIRDRDAARRGRTEVARGQAGHDPVHLLGGRTERQPAGAPATDAGPVEWPASAGAGCPAPPAAVLPHAASTTTALTAITASTHCTAASSGPLRLSAVSAGLL